MGTGFAPNLASSVEPHLFHKSTLTTVERESYGVESKSDWSWIVVVTTALNKQKATAEQ